MRSRFWCAVMACVSAWFGLVLSAQEPMVTLTTRDGVYTAAQAKRGEPLFMTRCAYCHRDEATGGQQILLVPAPPLVGSDFVSYWEGRPLEHLLMRIQVTMPQGEAGTLSREECADILAYMLQDLRFPPGQDELPADRDLLETIIFQPRTRR